MAGLNYGNKYCLSNKNNPVRTTTRGRKIYVFDKDENLIKEYPSIDKCLIEENLREANLRAIIMKRLLHKKKYYSYSENLKPDTKFF